MSSLAGVTPFPPEFAARYRARGYWEDVPLGRFYAGVFASHGDRVAMVSGSKRVTYAELRERVERLALHLLDLGVVPLHRWIEINAFFELSGASGYAVSEGLGDFDSRELIAQIQDAHSEVRKALGTETIREL